MMRGFVAASLGVAVAVAGLAAQDPAPLDRIIERSATGGPFVRTPATGSAMTAYVRNVALYAGVSMGIEGAPSDEPFPGNEEIEAARGRELTTLAGMTVRDALDSIVRLDPRYRWIDLDGVPVVRPIEAWGDRRNLLNQPVGPVGWEEVDVAEAMRRFRAVLYGRVAGERVLPLHGPIFPVRLRQGSFVGLLNEIARSRGGADASSRGGVVWAVHYRCGTGQWGPRPLYVFVLEFEDGRPSGGGGSCMPDRPSIASLRTSGTPHASRALQDLDP